jgi:NADPH:quinone reductase-like Zn-dependent oxidoreductase
MCTTRAYAITAEAIDREKTRCAGDLSRIELARILELCELELPPLGSHDVRLRIIAVSAEHNVLHALLADMVDIVKQHGGRLIPGNSAVAEVLEVGRCVVRFKPGDIVQTHCNGRPDRYGYPERIWGFDAPGSVGWYAEHAVVGEWQVIPVPLACGLSLEEIAALPLRAPTAYHLWRRAIGILRIKVPQERRARLNVLGFGGGVSELFLMLARAEGHAAYFCSGSPARREALEQLGIHGIDQGAFDRFRRPEGVTVFREEVRRLTAGDDMHIVCDMLRGRIFPAGIAVTARGGVNVSAGWQLSPVVEYSSALLSVKQITLDHTHYETIGGCGAATELYGSVFKPTLHHEVYAFEDLPRCFQEMHRNQQSGIPIIRMSRRAPTPRALVHDRAFS